MKTTWKWIPVARYHISAAEAWLTKMAARGLLFKRFFGPFAQFEVSEPKPGRRYRLEVNPDFLKRLPDQMEELYKQAGWQPVGQIWGRSFYVFYSDDPLAMEPYTDSQSRADSLPQIVRICRSEARYFTHVLFVELVLAALNVLMFFSSNESLVNLVLSTLSALFPYTLYCFSTAQNLRTVQRMRRWLEEGNSLRSFAPPKSQLAIQSLCWYMILTGTIMTVLTLPLVVRVDHIKPLDQVPPRMELLLLADIEGEDYIPDDFDPYNVVAFGSGNTVHNEASINMYGNLNQKILCRNYFERTRSIPFLGVYQFRQSGTSPEGPVQMKIQRCDTLYAGMAEDALAEMMGEGDYHEIAVPGADQFLVSESGNQVCARLGRRVVQVGYLGNQELSLWYDEIVDMLQAKG